MEISVPRVTPDDGACGFTSLTREHGDLHVQVGPCNAVNTLIPIHLINGPMSLLRPSVIANDQRVHLHSVLHRQQYSSVLLITQTSDGTLPTDGLLYLCLSTTWTPTVQASSCVYQCNIYDLSRMIFGQLISNALLDFCHRSYSLSDTFQERRVG